MRDGPIVGSKLIMPNLRQQMPTSHMRQSVPGQMRSREVDAMGRPIEMERSIEESLQLIQRHVEQLNMVSVSVRFTSLLSIFLPNIFIFLIKASKF